jgi:hypothetical protein
MIYKHVIMAHFKIFSSNMPEVTEKDQVSRPKFTVNGCQIRFYMQIRLSVSSINCSVGEETLTNELTI